MENDGTPGGPGSGIGRRDLARWLAGAGFGTLLVGARRAWAIDRIDNPLREYPRRDWERVYRDLYATDSHFHFLCAPNDTHNCLLRAEVKNGVVVRVMPSYGYGRASDLYGNRASGRWDPRACQKGLAMSRRIYGDRRVRYPMVRRGFKQWVERGMPRDTNGNPPPELMRRGWDTFERIGWDEAATMVARVLVDTARTYSGPQGAEKLRAQGYDPATIEAMGGAGTQTLKFRGGMPLLGVTRILALYRMANAMALLDAHVRGVGPDQARGGRAWDNYSWHTDLPPGHTMVTGTQTVEFDLNTAEHAGLVVVWGMNWISTKMPDGHWLTEARLKGTKITVIACEYGSTTNKADHAIIVRPGVTPALALGVAHVLLRDQLYDADVVKQFTDLPLLVRMDNLQKLRASDVFPNYRLAPLRNATRVMADGEQPPPPGQQQGVQHIPAAMRAQWGDFVVWDQRRNGPVALSRDQVGTHFARTRLDPRLEGEVEVRLADGSTVRCRPVFDLVKQYVMENFSPAQTEAITWAPAAAVEQLARDIAANKRKTLFAVGMGPNQFFNNDLKDRAIFLVAALTDNVGHVGGNVGSYAGNYRVALFNGIPQYINENPFDLELDPSRPARVKQYWTAESAHYFNHEDKPLRVGNRLFTGRTHMPAPTKTLWFSNSNSILGNAKWHYQLVNHVLPRMDLVCINEWWWSPSCEYADVVFPVDSWAEFRQPDMTASPTNNFLHVYPTSPLPRVHDTRGDIEVAALVAEKLAELTGEARFRDLFRFVREGESRPYLQRVLDASTSTRGYRFDQLEAAAREGTPTLMLTRTYPRAGGWEQRQESRPWYTKSGRLEFYRDELEFIGAGENLPVHREPVDSTFYEPNVIVAAPHPAIRPEGPDVYGVRRDDLSVHVRQARNVVRPWSEVQQTRHPRMGADGFRFIFHTPKYRHGVHTTPIDLDVVAVLHGPFGDVYRHDRRMPWVTEGYVDIHPDDARELGIEDGDYVWIDADPEDRPFRDWQGRADAYKVARLMARARYYPGTPRGVTRMFFHMYAATPGSVRGHESRADGLARNENTNYQAMFRYGSHQSATRVWLKPTLMTDSLARKHIYGHLMGQGFLPDSHCPTGAPREAFVKITRAEPGGLGGSGRWRPVERGLRPGSESEAYRRYLEGGFVEGR
ncbi:MAG: molybdopterin-dependent oxidoreductase [Myxococcales bacterium]|nr:molybdopterin-dependent oxidoreductase [Myxococcales bacterium]